MLILLTERISVSTSQSEGAESASQAVLCPGFTLPMFAIYSRVGLVLLAVQWEDVAIPQERYAALKPL